MANLSPILYSDETVNADAAPSLNAAFEQIYEESGIKPVVLAPLGGARTKVQQAALVAQGPPNVMNSDHREDAVGRAAVDINNQGELRAWDEARFLEIMAAHGWHNMTNTGSPFPTEPWHFAIHGLSTADNGSTPINNVNEDDMEIQNFQLGTPAEDFFYNPADSTLTHSLDNTHTVNLRNWYKVNQLGQFDQPKTEILLSLNSSITFNDVMALPRGKSIRKPVPVA